MKKTLIVQLGLVVFSLLLSVVLAQGTTTEQTPHTLTSIISQLSSIIFILAFVLILLWLGGVIKPGAGRRFPWFLIFFIVCIVLLFVIPQFVPYPMHLEVPESFKMVPLPSYAAEALRMLGLPSEWMYIPAIIYLFLLPFAGIYTLVWAFLTSLKIFEGVPSNVNRVLAFIITFLTIPVGWFVKIVWVVFSFIGIWSVVIFAAMFMLALFFRGYGYVEKERYEAMGKRWRAEARRHIQNALSEIKNKQNTAAINEINSAKNFMGYHSDYYKQLETAANLLNQTPPNYDEAEKALKKALEYI